MGVVTHTDEATSSVSPSRMFAAMFCDGHNLMPKLMPDRIKSVDVLEGNGGAGSIIQINFCGGPIPYIKQRMDFIDKENHICKYSLIEGAMLGDKLEKVSHEVKLEATSNGGSIAKITSHFHCKGDAQVDPEEVKIGKANGEAMHKAFEDYLTKNPEVYA